MIDAPSLPAGVVFDCDGTIVDTEPISDRSWTEVLSRYGYVPTAEDFAEVIGHPYRRTYAYFRDRVSIPDDPDEFRAEIRATFREIFDDEVEFFHDVLDVMRALHGAGVPLAVASSSSHDHVERVLDRAGVTDLVEVVLGSDDCVRHKPHPEPYLRSAEAIGVDPHRCSAVEDSRVGVTAARAAGMWTVALERPNVDRDLLAEADLIVTHLEIDHLVRPPR